MNDWYTADLHLGHDKVAQIRGYTNTETHNRDILANIFHTVKPGDRLWILGDLTRGDKVDESMAMDHLGSMCHRHNREIHIIAGNHDSFHSHHRRAHEKLNDYQQKVHSIASSGTIKIAGQRGILSHLPYDGDHTDHDRFEQWRPRDLGALIIHGHTHSTEPVSRSQLGTLQINVGLDAWNMVPVSKGALATLIQEHTP